MFHPGVIYSSVPGMVYGPVFCPYTGYLYARACLPVPGKCQGVRAFYVIHGRVVSAGVKPDVNN